MKDIKIDGIIALTTEEESIIQGGLFGLDDFLAGFIIGAAAVLIYEAVTHWL